MGAGEGAETDAVISRPAVPVMAYFLRSSAREQSTQSPDTWWGRNERRAGGQTPGKPYRERERKGGGEGGRARESEREGGEGGKKRENRKFDTVGKKEGQGTSLLCLKVNLLSRPTVSEERAQLLSVVGGVRRQSINLDTE